MKDYQDIETAKRARMGLRHAKMGRAVNVCNRPGLGASKNDLSELHDEKMRNKRLRYHAKDKRGRPTFQTHRRRPTSGNEGHQNWPDDKFAGAHNNCATSLKYRKGS